MGQIPRSIERISSCIGDLLYLYPFVYYGVCTMHMSILLFALSDFSFVDLPSVL